jgi:FlaA1/EpsC-like NDP-sugar epimerase
MLVAQQKLLKEFKNKKILITGGTGSIGIGLAKQLINFKPKSIRILANDENSIFEMKQMFGKNPMFTFMMGDIRDRARLDLAIKNIDIVFHTAAMKHVDICEQNPFDAVKTNVIGTSNILEASLIENISKFVFISTDKATNPSSTLGASKLLAERLTMDANSYRGSGKTIFSIVRFGNVIGSRGSVFQIFLEQIKKHRPLTITDSRMTRFIMSISEATNLILEVTHKAKDGEVFILKMPSVTITNLAKTMIKICNKKISSKEKLSSIKTSKLKEGERFEEFLITDEEIPFCQDLGKMYKITKNISNTRKVSKVNFNSSTATKISQDNLEKIILELLEEYN